MRINGRYHALLRLTNRALLIFAVLCLAALACAACGSGIPEAEEGETLLYYNGEVTPIDEPITQVGKFYVSAARVLGLYGYEQASGVAEELTNSGLNAVISLDKDSGMISKGPFKYDAEDEYIIEGNGLYLSETLLSKLANAAVTVTPAKGKKRAYTVSVKDVDTSAGAWVNMAEHLVAHACGDIDGRHYTNSADAIIYNYELGHRVFEMDFNLTSDGVMVGIHDWGASGIAKSNEEFFGSLIQGLYTPTSFDQVVELMAINRDIFLVTDTKSFEYTDEQILEQFQYMYDAAAKAGQDVLNRIVVQVYNRNMYHLINTIYKYPNILYTLYMTPDTEDQVIEFIRLEEIPVVVMPPERANEKFLRKIKYTGAKVFLHTLNDTDEMLEWKDKGIWGFYTDAVLPKDFTAAESVWKRK